MFFDPNKFETPSRVDINAPATAIPVRADYDAKVNTPNVTNGKAISIQWGLVGDNGRGTVIRQTYFIEGTSADDKARSVLAGTCKAIGFTDGLESLEVVDQWLSQMVESANPVTLVLEPEGNDSKYARVRYVNPCKAEGYTGTRIRAEFGDLITAMTAKADESAKRLESARTAHEGDLEGALGI